VNPADLESGARDHRRAFDELDSDHFRIAHGIDEETVKRMERLDAYKRQKELLSIVVTLYSN
jgi:hypothetical protein